jgi:hypothetical protein
MRSASSTSARPRAKDRKTVFRDVGHRNTVARCGGYGCLRVGQRRAPDFAQSEPDDAVASGAQFTGHLDCRLEFRTVTLTVVEADGVAGAAIAPGQGEAGGRVHTTG